MARRRREQLNHQPDVFNRGEGEATVFPSIQQADAATYGLPVELAKADQLRKVAEAVDIFSIQPDPTQPRRALPSGIRAKWDNTPEDLARVFDEWINTVYHERGEEYAHALITAMLLGEQSQRLSADAESENPADEYQPAALEATLLEIVELAASIRRDGLLNPITVVPRGDRYQLETGERRWLATHLLYAWATTYAPAEAENYRKIFAVVVNSVDVWRQASENNARANLNAISKARQFAILLMDILQQERGTVFRPFDALVPDGACDRAYYAQVSSGEDFRIPRHKGEQLLNAMGFKNGKQLKQHRALLRLPDFVWLVADDLNWTEGKLRLFTLMPPDDAVRAACHQARVEGYKGPFDPLCAESIKKSAPKTQHHPHRLTRFNRSANDLMRLSADDITRYDTEQRAELRNLIRQLEMWMQDMKKGLGI